MDEADFWRQVIDDPDRSLRNVLVRKELVDEDEDLPFAALLRRAQLKERSISEDSNSLYSCIGYFVTKAVDQGADVKRTIAEAARSVQETKSVPLVRTPLQEN